MAFDIWLAWFSGRDRERRGGGPYKNHSWVGFTDSWRKVKRKRESIAFRTVYVCWGWGKGRQEEEAGVANFPRHDWVAARKVSFDTDWAPGKKSFSTPILRTTKPNDVSNAKLLAMCVEEGRKRKKQGGGVEDMIGQILEENIRSNRSI